MLAAGLGTRFGGPKARAECVSGVRFLDAVIETAKRAGIERIIAVVGGDTMVPSGVHVVVNSRGDGEQIETARLGLTAAEDGIGEDAREDLCGALLWPVDHPFVQPGTVRALLERIAASDPDAAVPVHEGRRGHPVYFARRRWNELRVVADGGARAVLHALGALVIDVPVNDAGILADINTRDALASWRDGFIARSSHRSLT